MRSGISVFFLFHSRCALNNAVKSFSPHLFIHFNRLKKFLILSPTTTPLILQWVAVDRPVLKNTTEDEDPDREAEIAADPIRKTRVIENDRKALELAERIDRGAETTAEDNDRGRLISTSRENQDPAAHPCVKKRRAGTIRSDGRTTCLSRIPRPFDTNADITTSRTTISCRTVG